MKIQVFWDMTPCRLVRIYRLFGWAFFNSRSWLLKSWLYCQRLLRNVGNFYYIYCFIYQNIYIFIRGTHWHSWLRHCATSLRVTDLITYGII